MGDMADFALDQVVEEEIYRANVWDADMCGREWAEYEEEYGHQPQPPIPELDLGVQDARSLDMEISRLQYQMDSIQLQQIRANRQSIPYVKRSDAFRQQCRKYTPTWEMRAGMAKQLRIYQRPLSEKQTRWMETNYKGGTAKFVHDIEDDITGPELLYNLTRFAKWVKLVGDGGEANMSWAQATKQTTKELPDD